MAACTELKAVLEERISSWKLQKMKRKPMGLMQQAQ
jgi:hypothetical protein